LNDLDKSVAFAIESRDAFRPSSTDEFTTRVVAHAIKQYVHSLNTPETHISCPLEAIVRSVLTDLLVAQKSAQVLCLAIETRLQDFVASALHGQPLLFAPGISLAITTATDTRYRQQLLSLFVEIAADQRDTFRLAQLYNALHRADQIANLLFIPPELTRSWGSTPRISDCIRACRECVPSVPM
jgi:hypothetical protein